MSFIHDEARVSETCGVGRADLRKFRRDDLVRGVDWQLKDGAVRYSDSGIEKIAARFGFAVPVAGLDGWGEGETPTGDQDDGTGHPCAKNNAPADVVTLSVARICPNPIWVQAAHEGKRVNILVKNNRFMRLGASIRCQLDGGRKYFLRVRE